MKATKINDLESHLKCGRIPRKYVTWIKRRRLPVIW